MIEKLDDWLLPKVNATSDFIDTHSKINKANQIRIGASIFWLAMICVCLLALEFPVWFKGIVSLGSTFMWYLQMLRPIAKGDKLEIDERRLELLYMIAGSTIILVGIAYFISSALPLLNLLLYVVTYLSFSEGSNPRGKRKIKVAKAKLIDLFGNWAGELPNAA